VEHDHSAALLEFSVSDTGCGIAKDKLDLLYNDFSQVSSDVRRNYGGSGLGLSIVRKSAELMGGTVGVESTLGQGSRFWFRIRVARLPANP
jgi:signal transduction histidine kinase